MSSERIAYRFEELCDIKRGASPRPIQDWMAPQGIPWVKISDATAAKSRFIEKTAEFIKEEGARYSVSVKPGDFILSNSATPGMPKIMRISACIHDGWLLLRNFRHTTQDYCYYLLLHERSKLVAKGNGSVFTNLKTEILKNHVVEVPPLDEQARVVEVLHSIDDRIDCLRQENSTLDLIASSIFRSWFIDFDPVRVKAEGREPEGMSAEIAALFPSEFVDSELGPIPKGWCVKPLDEIANFLNGLAMQKYPPEGGDSLPVIKIAQLRKGDAVGADRASAKIGSEYIVGDGDVLFSWSGSLEVDVWAGGKGGLNQHLFKVTSAAYPKWFYYLAVKHHLAGFREIAANKATTMGHIQRRHLSEAKIAVPESSVLANLGLIFEPLFERALLAKIQARSLVETRDVLLPALLSGRIAPGPA